MTVTKILGAQSGLQYQGVQDKSEADPRDSLTNALFTGEFKRGPFNKPFKVTQANIRAKLGFDPENIQYQAIEDLLKQGVPFIWVMRIDTELKWGPWQINEMNILGAVARFIGSKTNTRETYNGSAQIDLTVAITASLSDSNMQQWQAVKDACNELTGVTNWFFDPAQSSIRYKEATTPVDCGSTGSSCPTARYLFESTDFPNVTLPYVWDISFATRVCTSYKPSSSGPFVKVSDFSSWGNPSFECKYDWGTLLVTWSRIENPSYNPDAAPTDERSIPFTVIAQKIISNASSSNQAISLLAETYIQEVAKGVTLDNLIDQFEQTKIKI